MPPIGGYRCCHLLFTLDRTLDGLHRPSGAWLQRSFAERDVAGVALIGAYRRDRQASISPRRGGTGYRRAEPRRNAPISRAAAASRAAVAGSGMLNWPRST